MTTATTPGETVQPITPDPDRGRCEGWWRTPPGTPYRNWRCTFPATERVTIGSGMAFMCQHHGERLQRLHGAIVVREAL